MDTSTRQRIGARLWGEFRLADGAGQPIEITSRRARALFALLAVAPEASVPRDRLASMLWSDRSDTHARANLRQLLYELKSLARGPSPVLGFDRRGVWLQPDFELDTEAHLRMDAAELALRLPPRDVIFLADLDGISEQFDEWLSSERATAEAKLRQVVQMQGEAALARGAFADVRALADAWCMRDPTDETIARFGLRADAELGDASGFARRLGSLESTLANELGVSPAAATAALARELSLHLRTAAPAPPVAAAAPAPAPATPAASAAPPSVAASTAPPPVAVSAAPATAPAPLRDGGAPRRATRWIAAAAVAVLGIAGVATVLWQTIALHVPSAATAQAIRLTANARELSHGRARAGYTQAAAIARRAIAADPAYAPAWAELAFATWMRGGWIGDRPPAVQKTLAVEVDGYLQRALALDPHLARALAVRGMVIGGAPGAALLDAAVREDPDDAESWIWLANARIEFGRMREALEATRRAAELDPLWDRSTGAYVSLATELGEPRFAVDAALDRFAAANPNQFAAETLRAQVAIMRGDLVAAARHGAHALQIAPEDPWIEIVALAQVARAVGDSAGVQHLASRHEGLRPRFESVFDPDGAVARAQGDAELWWQSVFYEDEARALVHAGRPDLLLALVARQPRPLLDFVDHACSDDPLPFSAMLSVTLRRAGRVAEADALAAAIRNEVARLDTAGGSGYLHLDLNHAIALALDGHDAAAVAALDRAVDHGWRGQFSSWAVDPADEPVFAHLRGRPDFERVRARLASELAAVRPQVVAIFAEAPMPQAKLAAADESFDTLTPR
jgi:DNA-binding SARP family transcriptional activator